MLVLTRKKNETIHIGGNVVIKVISTGRGKVKIGIEAPNAIRVRRGEMVPSEEPTADEEATEEVPGAGMLASTACSHGF